MSQAIDRPGETSEWVAAITSRIAFQPHSWIPELNTDISAMVFMPTAAALGLWLASI